MDDLELRALIADADLPSLLPALAYALADPDMAPDDLWLDPERTLEPNGGWSDEQAARAHHLACNGLRHLLDGTTGDATHGLLSRLINWVSGTDLDPEYQQMLIEELAIAGDLRVPEPLAGGLGQSATAAVVVVIGAGMSGILAAHRLQQAGVSYVVLEKNDDVGGTWFENTYPGCRVDVFNHVYAYAGAQRADWPEYHSSQPVLLDYFRDCADEWGIRSKIRFGVRVESITWREDAHCWSIEMTTASGQQSMEASAVVTAVGQLNLPLIPAIDGIETFAGEWFHSSSWRHDLDLEGRRVGVIGTGASAMQFIPRIAQLAREVSVFQRTPPWLIPRPEYHERLPQGLVQLFEMVPGYANWFRLRLFWRIHEGSVSALRRDPQWDGPLDKAVSERNDFMREALTLYLMSEFGDRPDLLSAVVPNYPVGAKRIVLDNGIWARTLKRPNVTLETSDIDRVTEDGVRMANGAFHDLDVLIYGTGFQASRFLMPMKVTGREGVDLHEIWADDPRAYLGITVPGFPNLFCLYGPNTNIVINGSIIYFSECEVHYLVECMRMLGVEGARALDCRREVFDAYVARVDERNGEMAWGISSVNSWYKSASGRVAQNWPFPLVDYWRQTRRPDPDDYLLT